MKSVISKISYKESQLQGKSVTRKVSYKECQLQGMSVTSNVTIIKYYKYSHFKQVFQSIIIVANINATPDKMTFETMTHNVECRLC